MAITCSPMFGYLFDTIIVTSMGGRWPDAGSSGPGLSPGQGHCVVFLGGTIYSHSALSHPGVLMGTGKRFNAGGNPAMD